MFKFWPISFIKDFWVEGFDIILWTNENWGKWSDIVAVMLPDIILWKIKLKDKTLLMRVFEWLVILVGCKIHMYGVEELEASESKKLFVGWLSL